MIETPSSFQMTSLMDFGLRSKNKMTLIRLAHFWMKNENRKIIKQKNEKNLLQINSNFQTLKKERRFMILELKSLRTALKNTLRILIRILTNGS